MYDRDMDNHHHLEALYPDTSREKEISQLLSFIKDGKSAQLVGMPGVGRGNLCKFLTYSHDIRTRHLGEAQTQYHFVFINFAEVKNRPLGDVLKFIFLELVSSLHERKLEDAFAKTDTIFKKSLSYKDDLVLFQGLKDAVDYLVHEKNLHIILLFERFEMYIPLLTDDFFVSLRSLRERAKYKFSVVFSLTRPLEESVEPKILADFYEFFAENIVYLSLWDKPGIAFRIGYLEQLANKKLPSKLLAELETLTGGHGKLMRLGTEALLARDVVIPSAVEGSLTNLFGNTDEKDSSTSLRSAQNDKNLASFLLSQKTIQGALFEITAFLTPSEQAQLRARENNEFLHTIGLFEKNNTIAIPLLAAFLQTKQTIPQKETISFDNATNTIRKGDLVISESLTAAEFRLLVYFLEHPDTILDRETIIEAVWKDQASIIGVTDQALDQLIFRLRKKIEQDPNNPTHIQTVKGRGIKFAP